MSAQNMTYAIFSGWESKFGTKERGTINISEFQKYEYQKNER